MDSKLRSLSRAVRLIRQEVNHELPIQQLAMLLEVSLNEGVSMSELSRSLKMGQGSVSKNVKLMSQFIDAGVLKGFGLLSTSQDLAERRRFIVNTTAKGRDFLQRLAGLLNQSDFRVSNGIREEAVA